MDTKEKESLLSLMERELKRSGIYVDGLSIRQILTSDKNSATFMRNLLEDDSLHIPNEKSQIYTIAQSRARHSVINYLLGRVIMQFGGIYKEFNSVLEEYTFKAQIADKVWTLTTLYHDIGYFKEDIRNSDLDYKTKYKYYLYTDDYNYEKEKELDVLKNYVNNFPKAFAYSYEEIEAYDIFDRNRRAERKDIELLNHGIYGGAYLFDQKMRKVIKTNGEKIDFLIIKLFCITIAQHNIFKSESRKEDIFYPEKLYKLKCVDEFRISQETPILLFLSLIDTIECVKRFSKKENSRSFLTTCTVLDAIKVSVADDMLCLDFKELKKKVLEKNNHLKEVYYKYIRSLVQLDSWTIFKVALEEDIDVIKICL